VTCGINHHAQAAPAQHSAPTIAPAIVMGHASVTTATTPGASSRPAPLIVFHRAR